MNRRTIRLRSALPLAVLLLGGALWPSLAVAQTTVVATDLGTLGGTHSSASAVNDNGQVVGSSNTADGTLRAFWWTQASEMRDLGTPLGCCNGTFSSRAAAVNANGQVVGDSLSPFDSTPRAFSWTQAGGMVELGRSFSINSQATAVNASGQVVGKFAGHAFSWTPAGGMVTFGGPDSMAAAVNANGQVVGTAAIGSIFTARAFSWTQAGGMVDLGTLGVYGSAGAFTSTLQAASNQLASGNVNAACGSLGAFENQVNAKIGKTLTAAQGAALIAAANQMQAASGCN